MVTAMGFMTWFVIPGLKRIALKQKLGKDFSQSELKKFRNQEKFILLANLILAIFVLIFTAWARSVS
jgi:peptidoglycan biosynthesis protein MviN/MurJ (putative lipid II flippase)